MTNKHDFKVKKIRVTKKSLIILVTEMLHQCFSSLFTSMTVYCIKDPTTSYNLEFQFLPGI
jgi:hypothetical protein